MGDESEFKRYEQHQGTLLPPFVGDALEPSDVTFFIDDAVEGLDLRGLERRCSTMGEHAYPPRMLLKLWLLGAIEGVYSGRAIARRLYFDLRFQYLAGALRPDFRTINRFRERHRAERPFAEIIQRLRFQRFMLRGQEKVRGEWDLVCAALNLQTRWRRASALTLGSGS